MNQFRSCAKWEEKHGFYNNMTYDTHETKHAASCVCQGLEREGLGGEKIHFPLETWVEESIKIPTYDGFSLIWVREET